MYDLLWKRANEHGQFLKYSAQIMEKKNHLAMMEKKQDSIFQYFYNYAYQTRMKIQTSWSPQ